MKLAVISFTRRGENVCEKLMGAMNVAGVNAGDILEEKQEIRIWRYRLSQVRSLNGPVSSLPHVTD